MKNGLSIRPARRSAAKPLVGLYAKSGCGKTLSALYLARGFIGPTGKIVMIETESGRGEVFADMIPGGYRVVPLTGGFSSKRYGEAITLAEEQRADALIIDSASHEWEGVDGVLHAADKNREDGKKGMQVWTRPKIDHSTHFMLRLMQTPIPLIVVCMRAKYPMEEGKDSRGRKTLVRSRDLSPKQDEDILFEMFIHGHIDQQHRFHGTKYTRPDLEPVIPSGEMISITTGERLAEWAGGGAPRQDRSQEAVDLFRKAKDLTELTKRATEVAGYDLIGAGHEAAKAAYLKRSAELSRPQEPRDATQPESGPPDPGQGQQGPTAGAQGPPDPNDLPPFDEGMDEEYRQAMGDNK